MFLCVNCYSAIAIAVLIFVAESGHRKKKAMEVETIKYFKDLGGVVYHSGETPESVRKGLVSGFGKGYFVNLSDTKVKDSDLEKLRNLRPLVSLSVDDTLITDKGLTLVTEFPELVGLSICGTNASNDACIAIKKLKKLSLLKVSQTKFGDSALESICDACPLLVSFTAEETDISDKGALFLGKLSKLERVVLSGCKVSNKGIEFARNLPKLEKLWLNETKVSKGLGEILKDRKLTSLWLAGTKIDDADLAQLGKMQTLVTLNLRNTGVSDKGVVELVELKNLVALHLAGTKVTAKARDLLTKSNPKISFFSVPYEEKK